MDFVIELLPHHLDPEKIPKGIRQINYKFALESVRWRLHKAIAKDKAYSFRVDVWQELKKDIDQ